MFTKLTLGGALVVVALAGGAWALAGKKSNDCCFPGSDCCYPGSPCCDDSPKATPGAAGKVDCCSDPTCPPGCSPDCPPNCPTPTAAKPATGCEGGKCTTNCKAD